MTMERKRKCIQQELNEHYLEVVVDDSDDILSVTRVLLLSRNWS